MHDTIPVPVHGRAKVPRAHFVQCACVWYSMVGCSGLLSIIIVIHEFQARLIYYGYSVPLVILTYKIIS
jgi:hypothetical protein